MAVSGYGNNKNKVMIYYIVIALIIIAAAIFIFYPHRKNKLAEQTDSVAQQPSQQTQPAKGGTQQTATTGTVQSANSVASNPRLSAMITDAQNCINEGKIITARNTLNDALNMSMDNTTRETVKTMMTGIADQWLFTRVIQLGDELCSSYKVQAGDNLAHIAAQHKVPYKLLMKVNNITSDRGLRSGQVIKVVNGPFHAVAYKSSYIMDLYLQNIYVKSYKIGIGKEGHETPVGLWRAKVGGKMIKPTWTDPDTGRTYHASDPDYPLG